MNRAWIPAGALAGVSVAGLIAVGQLTSSLGTEEVSFPSSVAVTSAAPSPHAVPVSYPAAVVGKITHAALTRGGQAATQTPTSGEAGQVSVPIQKSAPATQPTAPTPTTSATVPKKKPKRRDSIGGVTSGSTNGDAGLTAGGTHSKSANGVLMSTPNADAPAP